MGLSNYIPSSRVSQAGVCTSTTRPASPYEGQMIYETDTNRVLVYDNTAWVMIADTDTPPGLELIKTQTVGSGVTSVTVTNVFSSTFDNYRVVIAGIDCSSGNQQLQLNLVGTTNLHYGSLLYDLYSGANTNYARSNNAGAFSISMTGTDSDTSSSFDINNPNVAVQTTVNGTYYGGGYSGWFAGIVFTTTQYTDFKLQTTGSVTMTGGTIKVYGYRNS